MEYKGLPIWAMFKDECKQNKEVAKKSLYNDAIATGKSYRKAIDFVKKQKSELGRSFSASSDEAVEQNLWNDMCDEVARQLFDEALDQTIGGSKHDS